MLSELTVNMFIVWDLSTYHVDTSRSTRGKARLVKHTASSLHRVTITRSTNAWLRLCLQVGHIHSIYYYRPQRTCGKVMFSQGSVILFTGGGRHPPPEMATTADGMHPTGMHSCLKVCLHITSPCPSQSPSKFNIESETLTGKMGCTHSVHQSVCQKRSKMPLTIMVTLTVRVNEAWILKVSLVSMCVLIILL